MRKTFTILFVSLFSLTSFSQNNALHFDGTNDYVTIPDRSGVLTSNTFTFEAWVKTTGSYEPLGPVLHKMNDAFDQGLDVYFYGAGNGHIEVDLYTTATPFYLDYALPASWVNTWHHIAVTYNGSSLQLYVDGVPAQSAAASGSLSVTGSTTILGYYDPSNAGNYNGVLEEVRFWNTARTQAQIQSSMNTELPATTSGLTAYYRFNQGTANGNNAAITTITDDVAGNNGTLVNFARTGSTSNFVPGNGALSVLALNDETFTAVKIGSTVQLNWRSQPSNTATRFTIERSNNATSFAAIGTVNTTATSAVALHAFTDVSPISPICYYRIKTTAVDGSVSFSKTIAVAINNNSKLQAYPNPANGFVQLHFANRTGAKLIQIKELTGKTVKTVDVPAGSSATIRLEVADLPAGTYIITDGQESTLLIRQ